jgi:2-(1,2-epoxy-1,2-dihydrophenyl)acetyl-CoA isomerase
MAFDNIQFQSSDGLARLTLDRPEAANALNLDLAAELLEAATLCSADATIRAVLLTGSGKMFCAGGDLRSFADAGDEVAAHLTRLADTLHAGISKFARMNAPLVVAVNGAAAGAGMSLVCMSDLAIAAQSASFTMAYTAAGLTPDGSSTYYLPRAIGTRRAKELILTNRRLSAAEALDWGLVQSVVPDDELMAEAEKLATRLSRGPTLAFGAAKRLLIDSATSKLEAQMDAETKAIADMTRNADGREGIAAFLEKRRPEFKGR